MATQVTALPTVNHKTTPVTMRHLKVAVAASIALAGGYGLLCEKAYVTSSDAVVSAYVLDVRTPIDGIVTGLPNTTGMAVHEGQVLGHVENLRSDRQQLDVLRTNDATASVATEAIAAERVALETERQSLLVRADEHRAAMTSRLELQVTEAARVLAAEQLALKQATTEFARGRSLHDAGILSAANFDKVVSTQTIAAEQVAAQEAALASLRVQAASAARGVSSEPGTENDVSYSRQRADEIAIRLAENTRSHLTSVAQAREAHFSLAVETERSGLRERSNLVSPINGILWNLNAVTGERAATGDTVVSVVDCSRQFLLVSIPQDRVPEVALHQRAAFRLAGESEEHFGTVLSVSGDKERGSSHKYASVPFHTGGTSLATVVVGLDTPVPSGSSNPDACMVGRTARVLVPTVPTNVAGRLFRRYF